ncbi:MAG: hypothetical protein F4114_18460 [Rhodospirillaceae bacterium]|nr:hypothetical protein [Rhodospirillaceae bacterium]MYI51053.1 hypothetical protein [Rhodospirillaceae bacterium]
MAAADEGEKTVTILAGESAGTLTVRTDDDAVDEPDGSVTATLAAGTGYTVAASPNDAASVQVADNDVAAAGPSRISVQDVTVQEGGTAVIPVTLSPAPTKPVSLFYKPVSAGIGKGFATVADFYLTRKAFLHFGPGETLKYARIRTKQDSHDEGSERFQVMVVPARGDITPAGVPVYGTITITNSDPLPAAYASREAGPCAAAAEERIGRSRERRDAVRAPVKRMPAAGMGNPVATMRILAVTALAMVALAVGPDLALATTDTTFDAPLDTVSDIVGGTGGQLAAALAVGAALVGSVLRFNAMQLMGAVGVGIAAGAGTGIVTGLVGTAIV